MGHSLEEDLVNWSSLDHHWSYASCDVRCDEKTFSLTGYIPEDKIIRRPLGPWREEPEEKLESISNGNASNIKGHTNLSGFVLLAADGEESGPRRANVPVYFRNARSIDVEFWRNTVLGIPPGVQWK